MTARGTTGSTGGGGGAGSLTAAEVARAVGGRLVGDPDAPVRAVAPLDRAGEGDLSFLAVARYAPLFATSSASVVLVAPELAEAEGRARARVVVAKPHEAMLAMLPRLYAAPPRPAGVHPTAVIGRGVRLGADVALGAYAVIGDGAALGDGVTVGPHCVVGEGVEIGAESRLYASVTLYPGTRLGTRVAVHAGARLGSDGFGYVFRGGAHEKIPHVGRCLVEDDVEIGANTTIDRGSIDDTVIGAGTKIDNLVQVGHNVRIGRLCLLMAQVGVAGSVRVEDGCIIAGQVGIAGHHSIGAGARLAAQAGVFGDVPAGETWSGYPARPHREALRAQAALFKLPGMMRQLERLVEARTRPAAGGGAGEG
ncbi:MAG: UDP-3-O-(3-hydroxymyristoyl)glucosamine N-acyltransferase [Gemmatimonadaceae bacterium]